MHCISFKGEESARFARFATELMLVFEKGSIDVSLIGKEPLTSKFIDIKGKLNGALNSGYRRHVEILENDTEILYWAAGTNATASVATIEISFYLSDEQKDTLINCGKQKEWYIPTMAKALDMPCEWRKIDEAIQIINVEHAKMLIEYISNDNSEIKRESALALRSYASLMSQNIGMRMKCERTICNTLRKMDENDSLDDPRIAITELLGYVGTNRSIELLKALIVRTINVHVKWAAIIALGRISSDDIIDFYYEEISKCDNHEGDNNNTISSVSDNEWIKAALLLCISRRVNEINNIDEQKKYEELFYNYLKLNHSVLHRYACLGLSQMESIDEKVFGLLVDNISNNNIIIDNGYYAMALIPFFKDSADTSFDEKLINTIKTKLKAIVSSKTEPDNESEPGFIWGIENLAELSLEIEDNDLANRFHNILSNTFYDWRYYYYTALAYYEKAEMSLSKPYEYIHQRFVDAKQHLDDIDEKDEYTMSIVNFRKSIINARIEMLEIFEGWYSANDINRINGICKRMSDVINVFMRFTLGNSEQGASKSEIDCLSDTLSILKITYSLIELHKQILSRLRVDEEIVNKIRSIRVSLSALTNEHRFSLGHLKVIQYLRERVELLLSETDNGDFENILRLINELSLFFKTVSWTMPANMCMLTGLGKGIISVVNDNIRGYGISDDPYILTNDDTKIILSIQLEVSTGASVQTSVYCPSLQNERKALSIVEGIAISSFDITNSYFPISVTIPITFTLEFSTNEVKQKQDYVFYFRRV